MNQKRVSNNIFRILYISLVLMASLFHTVYAETLQEKILRLQSEKKTTTQVNIGSDKQDINLEIKLEDEKTHDLYLPVKVVWKNEKGETKAIKLFWNSSSLESLNIKVDKTESYWTVEITNAKLKEPIQIKLDYNKFSGTSSSKRILYYIQLIYDGKTQTYSKWDVYTQNDSIKEVTEQDLSVIKVTWKVTVAGTYIPEITVWLYTEQWEKIISTLTDIDWNFKFSISDVTNKLQLNIPYYLLYDKQGDIWSKVVGIVGGGVKYEFRNYRELSWVLWQQINLTTSANEKDIVKTQDFPWLFVLVLVLMYFWTMYFLLIRVIRSIYLHVLYSQPKSSYLDINRQNKLKRIKQNLWLEKS